MEKAVSKTITKMPLSICQFNHESAKSYIEKAKPENEFQSELLEQAHWAVLEYGDLLRIMREHNKDYVYLKEGGGVLKYEIGDLLFQ